MYRLSEPDREIQTRARAFVREHLIPHEEYAEAHEGELPPGMQETLHARVLELGLGAISMPESLGGPGFTHLQQTLISEQIGAVTNGLGWVVWTPPNWIVDIATRHQLDTWIVPTVEGRRSECYAITEEGAGSDVDAIEATAVRDGDDYVLNGVKWHVTSYNHADYLFFQAKLPEGNHALFFVDIGTPGINVDRTPAYTHTYSHHHPIISFADVRVPATNLVGDEGGGMRYAHAWFRYERLMIAARCCCGAAERLIDEATAFAKKRIAYGHPISEYQAIQFMLADSITELWAARLMTYETARAIDAGADVKLQHSQCSMAKLYASEMANRVADRAVQIFGGRGYMRENVAERFFRELRVDRIWEGTSEIQRLIIAAQLLKRGSGLIG